MIFVAAALEIGLLVGLMRLRRWLAQSRARLARIQARLAEAGRCAEARAQARARGERITGAVEAGTASLEALHRAIADLSFELSGDTRAREHQASGADRLYGSIRLANRGAGGLYARLLKPRKRR